jgi:hypothetical protein
MDRATVESPADQVAMSQRVPRPDPATRTVTVTLIAKFSPDTTGKLGNGSLAYSGSTRDVPFTVTVNDNRNGSVTGCDAGRLGAADREAGWTGVRGRCR